MVLSRRGGNGTIGLLTQEITVSYLHTTYHCIALKSSYHFVFCGMWVMQQVRIEAMNVNYVVREVGKQSEFVRECSAHRKPVCVFQLWANCRTWWFILSWISKVSLCNVSLNWLDKRVKYLCVFLWVFNMLKHQLNSQM